MTRYSLKGLLEYTVPETAGPLGERPPALPATFAMYQLLCRVNVTVSGGHLPDADSQMLDHASAKADSNHELSKF